MTVNMTSSLISTILCVLTLMSCTRISGGELQPEIRFSNPDHQQQGAGGWAGVAWTTSDNNIIDVSEMDRLCDFPLRKYSSGDVLDLVCYDDASFITPHVKTGIPTDRCHFKLEKPGKYTPAIFTGKAFAGKKDVLYDIHPVTACFKAVVTHAPESFSQAILSFSDVLHDKYYPKQKEIDKIFRTEGETDLRFSFGSDPASMNLLPMKSGETAWKPLISLKMTSGEIVEFTPSISRYLVSGDQAMLKLDLSRLEDERIVTMHYDVRNENAEPYSQSDDYLLTGAQENPDPETGGSRNPLYRVYLNFSGKWREAKVMEALCSDADKHGAIWNDWGNDKQLRDTMSYCIVDHPFDGPVKVRVEKLRGGFSSVDIRPTKWNIDARQLTDKMIEFNIPSFDARKLSIEFDGDRQHNLFLMLHRPDENKPDPADPNVIYFGPGEHDRDVIRLTDGQTLYLDYGAVLYSLVEVVGNHCTIAGHGILSGDKMRHWGGDSWSNGDIILKCNPGRPVQRDGLTIKDITIVNGPSWNVAIWNFDNVLIDGVNIIDWGLNGDGIDLICCRKVEVKNCLLRAYDDCITIKLRHINPEDGVFTDMCDVNVHHNLIWNDYARGIVVGPESGNQECHTGYIHDIDIHDCIFLQHKRGQFTDDLRGAFTIGQMASPEKGTPTGIENVHAWNLIFDNIDKTGRNVWLHQYNAPGTCLMKDILLEDFQIHDGNSVMTPAVRVSTGKHSIKGLKMRNIRFNGVKITGPGDELEIIGNVDYAIE